MEYNKEVLDIIYNAVGNISTTKRKVGFLKYKIAELNVGLAYCFIRNLRKKLSNFELSSEQLKLYLIETIRRLLEETGIDSFS